MADSIDNRVVSMDFDNKSFEKNTATSISTLDKLKSSLNFSDSKKGLDDLSTAGKNFNLDGIATAVEGIAQKFNVMGAVAFSVIANIVDRSINAGLRISQAFAIQPVSQGFQEYELKLGAIQTIMAGTGDNLATVNGALQELNAYSDKTIYSFSDMTSNISKFTNAGVNLKDSVAAIQGVANVAAISGANAGEAARAMYNFGQALSTGSIRLIDWKSIEFANMATKEFKQQLIDSAVAAGTLTKEVDGTYRTLEGTPVDAVKGFNQSLEEAWLTSDVLTKTLGRYADATTDIGRRATEAAVVVKTFSQLMATVKESIGSGWAYSFEIILGNFEEAKTLWTDINNSISGFVGKQADARNALLQGWKDIGGRTFLIAALKTGFEGLAEILGTIGKAFRDVFPKMTAEKLLHLTLEFRHLMQNLTLSGQALTAIRSLFEGLFSVVKIGVEVFKGVGHVVGAFFDGIAKAGANSGGVLKFLWSFGESLTDLRKKLVDDGGIERFFDKFTSYASNLGAAVSVIFDWLTILKDALISIFSGGASGGFDAFSDAASRVRDRFAPLVDMFKKVGDALATILERMGITRENLAKIGDAIKDFFSAIPQAIADVFAKTDYNQALDTVNTGLFAGLVLMFRRFLSGDLEFGGSLMKNISKSFKELTGVLQSMQTRVKADALIKIAIALGLLTASLVVLAMMDSAKLTKAMVAIGIGMSLLVAALTMMNNAIGTPKEASKIAILAGSLMAISAAMLLFAFAAKTLASMSWEELAKGMGGMTVMLAVMITGLNFITSNTKGLITAGISIILIATAMNILAGAVKLFSTMSYSEIGRGLVGIAGGLAAIVAAVTLMPSGPGMALKGAGVLAIAIAMNILAGAVKLFSMMSIEELAKGIGAIAVALLAIAGATQLMPNGVNLSLQGVGLLAISIGLLAMASAVKIFSTMSWSELLRGLTGLAVTLGLLAAAALVMQGSLGGALAIGVMSGALWILAKGLQQFAEISWQDLLKGLVGLAATLTILGLAALAMSESIPVLLGLGAALLLIGGAFALFGVGANLVATAFAIMATSGTQGLETISGALTLLITMIPPLLVALGEGIIKLGMKLVEAAPEFVRKMGEVLSALLDVVIKNIPKFGELLVTLIHAGLSAIRETFPDVVATGFAMLLALLKGIRDNIVEIVTVVVEIITGFLDALAKKVPEIIDSVFNLVKAIVFGVIEKLVDIGEWLLPKGLELLGGLLTGIGRKAVDIMNWFIALPGKIFGWLGSLAETLALKGVEILLGFITGLGRKVTDIYNWFIALPGKVVSWLGELADCLVELGKKVMQGLWNGLVSVWDQITGWLSSLNPANWFNDINPYKGHAIKNLLPTGKMVMQGLKNGMEEGWDGITSWLKTVDPSESIVKTLNGISDALNGMDEFNPTITPVLDLTEVTRGVSRLDGIVSRNRAIAASVSYGQALLISTSTIPNNDQSAEPPKPVATEFKFEQNIYSPEGLSTADIYRLTSNQITMAKEELRIR